MGKESENRRVADKTLRNLCGARRLRPWLLSIRCRLCAAPLHLCTSTVWVDRGAHGPLSDVKFTGRCFRHEGEAHRGGSGCQGAPHPHHADFAQCQKPRERCTPPSCAPPSCASAEPSGSLSLL